MANDPASDTLGTTVRQARERAGLSLRNLEAIVGVSRQLLLRLEHDEIDNPSPELLQQLADALELDSDDLFAFVDYQRSEKLPNLSLYLRARYRLPPAALDEARAALRDILDKYDRDHGSKSGHDANGQAANRLMRQSNKEGGRHEAHRHNERTNGH